MHTYIDVLLEIGGHTICIVFNEKRNYFRFNRLTVMFYYNLRSRAGRPFPSSKAEHILRRGKYQEALGKEGRAASGMALRAKYTHLDDLEIDTYHDIHIKL